MQRAPSQTVLAVVRGALLTALLAAPVYAQQWAARISEAARVRVLTRTDGEYEGTLRPPVNDSLRIIGVRGVNAEPRPIAFAIANVTSVDVGTGGSPLKRGLLGVVFGAVGGGIIGAAIGSQKECAPYGTNKPGECYSYSGERGLATALFAVTGAGAGALLGGIIGLASAHESWQNVYTNTGPSPAP